MSNLQQSLAELCSVCYISQPKYKCPRCKTQTCSLPCYKRHQQRASCNGQRDPAAYLRKSEWATPAGIDHDYNYLKIVERAVEKGGQNLTERGIAGSDFRQNHRGGKGSSVSDGRVAKSWLPGSALQRYLVEERIQVERAPVGMSRSKTNRTRVTPKGKVMWMVEWIEGDGERKGERRTGDESLAENTVGELWGEVVIRRNNAEAREKAGTKRKRGDEAIPSKRKLEEEVADSTTKREVKHEDPADEDAHSKAAQEVEGDLSHPDLATQDHHEDDHPKQEDIKQDPPPEDAPKADPGPSRGRNPPPKSFYLEKPLTASKSRILIPIDPCTTLTACLRGRMVLEYPTFHVFDARSEALPEGFELEEAYSKAQEAEQGEVLDMLKRTEQSTGGVARLQAEEKPLDAGSILDMLRRDVGT